MEQAHGHVEQQNFDISSAEPLVRAFLVVYFATLSQ
jgi:hypothetical protein